jgi:hypothetical protein
MVYLGQKKRVSRVSGNPFCFKEAEDVLENIGIIASMPPNQNL